MKSTLSFGRIVLIMIVYCTTYNLTVVDTEDLKNNAPLCGCTTA